MPVQNPSDAEIRKILTTARTIAVVGASPDPSRPSWEVTRFLIDKGFEVYPINPKAAGNEIHGRKVLAEMADAPVPIDMVDCFRRSEFIPPAVTQAVAIKAKIVWMQLGVINEPAAKVAHEAGLTVVMDRCPVIEWRRLGMS